MILKKTSGDLGLSGIYLANCPDSLRVARIVEQSRLLNHFASMHTEEWVQSVNDMHDGIMIRATFICEQELLEAGMGDPPAAYSFIVFGSAGRGEQTLWSDQDNGLIIGDGDEYKIEAYFSVFAQRMTELLVELGYPPCPGNVMLSRPMWRHSLQGWRELFRNLVTEPQWEQVRYLMIVSDMRHIAGDVSLSMAWLELYRDEIHQQVGIIPAILRNTIRRKASLNVLGQVITEQFGEHAGEFDVKYGLYIPLVNGIRYLGLQFGVTETSTMERIDRLYQLKAVPLQWMDSCRRAFRTALRLRSITYDVSEEGTLVGSSYLPESLLKNKVLMRELKDSLSMVRQLYWTLQRQHRFEERNKS